MSRRASVLLSTGLALFISAIVYAGIKDAQIHQFPAADLSSRTLTLNIPTVAATASRDAVTFIVPEPWIVTGVEGVARALAGTITTFTMDVKRTAGSVTASVLRTAVDMYTTDGLAGAGTRRLGELTSDQGNGYTLLNTGDIVTVNFVMVGSNTPLATDVSWSLHYRPTIGGEH